MNFYRDFTYYSDSHFENAINIGWVLPDEKWETKQVNQELISKLITYANYPCNMIRGGNYYKQIELAANNYLLGFAEFRIISADRLKKYAVPNMIIYSIIEQGYRPPEEFVKDVMNAIPPESKEYKDYLHNYNRVSLWGENKKYIAVVNEVINIIKMEISMF